MKSKAALLTALAIAYFGEYNSFISLLEHSRRLGSARLPILLYIVYCLPAVLLVVASAAWDRSFRSAYARLPYVYWGGALAALAIAVPSALSSSAANSVLLLVLGIFGLALFRQWTKVLTLTLLKSRYEGAEQASLLSSMVSLRFVVMILGATVGGILGERGAFAASMALQSATYVLAGVLFWTATRARVTPVEEPSSFSLSGFLSGLGEGFRKLRSTLGLGALSLIVLGYLASGSFMALEYPLLTGELHVLPSMLFIVYIGHILGAILAKRASPSLLKRPFSKGSVAILALALPASYLFVGFGPSQSSSAAGWARLGWFSAQLGLCAFFLPLFEIYYSTGLMRESDGKTYPAQALALNLLVECSNLAGSFLPLALVGLLSTREANGSIELGLGAGILILELAQRARPAVSAATRKSLSEMALPGALTAVGIALLISMESPGGHGAASNARQLEIHRLIAEFYREEFHSAENVLAESARTLLDAYPPRDRDCAPFRSTESFQLPHASGISSFYIPQSSKLTRELDCYGSATTALEKDWEKFLAKHSCISWIYTYDLETGAMRIAPSTDTGALFGKDLHFDKFSFFTLAVDKYPEIAWNGKAKEDVNGTGLILIGSKAFRLPGHQRKSVVSIDLNVRRLVKSRAGALITFRQENDLKDLFVFLYTKDQGSRFTAGDWVMDQGRWSSLKPKQGDILSVNPSEEGALAKVESDAANEPGRVISKAVTLRGQEYTCSASQNENPGVFLWICARY